MSDREDYLDSLLKSVDDANEDEFLKNFEQDFDEDEILREFERALEEPVKLRGNESDMTEPVKLRGNESDMTEPEDFAMQDTTVLESESEDAETNSMESEIDELLKAAMGAAETPSEEDTMNDFGMDFGMDFGAETDPYLESSASGNEDTELLDIFSGMPEETVSEGDDTELLDILAGMSDDDADLAEIGDLLKAHDSNERISLDDIDSLEDLAELGLEDATILDEEGNEQELSDKKKDKKKKDKKKDKKKAKDAKKSGGFFARLSAALFGEDDEDTDVPEAGELGNISKENMEILKDAEKKEKKNKAKKDKKEKQEKKKLEKQAKKEQKKQAKAMKPKKEKPPKEPAEKTKPLPKVPVILIFVLVTSMVVLIYLGTDFVGYTVNMQQSETMYDSGEYVEAYQLLRGMKIKDIHTEYYERTRLTAYVKKELETYEAYIDRKMYPEALDSLICAIGKYDKHGEEAAAVGAGAEFGGMLGDIEEALTQNFGVSIEEARDIYRQQSRTEYTVLLYEMLERAEITE